MNMIIIELKGRIPSKKNSRQIIISRGKILNIPSKSYRKWHKDMSYSLEKQIDSLSGNIIFPLEKVKEIHINLFFPDDRVVDNTNKTESIMDLLVDNGLLIDDCWQVTGQITMRPCGIDRENPRAEVFINLN